MLRVQQQRVCMKFLDKENKRKIMKIIFLRHGECINQGDKNYHMQNTGLTREGKAQCKHSAKYLKNEKIACIYSSPMKRAVDSAKIIAKYINAPIVILEEIYERHKIEEATNPAEQEVYDNYLNYNYKNKNYQTCRDFVDLTIKGLKKVIKNHQNKNENALIVGHSSNLYALNAYFNGIPESGNIVWMQCSNGACIKYEVLNKKK